MPPAGAGLGADPRLNPVGGLKVWPGRRKSPAGGRKSSAAAARGTVCLPLPLRAGVNFAMLRRKALLTKHEGKTDGRWEPPRSQERCVTRRRKQSGTWARGARCHPGGNQVSPAPNRPARVPRDRSGYRINPFSFGALRGEPFLRLLLFQMVGGKKKFLIRLRSRAAASLPAAASSQPQLRSCSCAPANF